MSSCEEAKAGSGCSAGVLTSCLRDGATGAWDALLLAPTLLASLRQQPWLALAALLELLLPSCHYIRVAIHSDLP